MVCCACGLRQLPRTGYCEQCDCPLGALVPPPTLGSWPARPQRLASPPEDAGPLGGAALLCAALGWLPLPFGPLGAALGVLLGAVALRRARAAHRHGAARRARAALLLGALFAGPTLLLL